MRVQLGVTSTVLSICDMHGNHRVYERGKSEIFCDNPGRRIILGCPSKDDEPVTMEILTFGFVSDMAISNPEDPDQVY